MSRRWKGIVTKVTNSRFIEGSPEHMKYKDKQKKYYYETIDAQRGKARERAAKKRRINQQYIVNYMQGKSCVDCGTTDIRVLAFDHMNDHQKYANISDLVSRGAPLQKLIDEVPKCRILCHNCHMIRTFEQIGGTYHSKVKPCTEREFQKMIEES